MKFIKGFFAFVLSFSFTIVLIVGLFLFAINSFVTKKNIENMVKEVGIENLWDLDDYIDENLALNLNVDEFINIPELNDVFSRVMGEAVEYIIYQKKAPQITNADITKIINASYFNNLTSTEKDILNKFFDDLVVTFNEELKAEFDELDFDEVLGLQNSSFSFKTIFSFQTRLIIISALIIIGVLICLCRSSWYQGLSWLGVSTIIAGGLNIFVSNLMKSEMQTDFDPNSAIDMAVLDNLFEKWSTYNYLALVIGVGLIVAYFVYGKRVKASKAITEPYFEHPAAN